MGNVKCLTLYYSISDARSDKHQTHRLCMRLRNSKRTFLKHYMHQIFHMKHMKWRMLGLWRWCVAQWYNLLFLEFVRRLTFNESQSFGSWLCCHLQIKKILTCWNPWIELDLFWSTYLKNCTDLWCPVTDRGKGSSRLGASLSEDGSTTGFRNVVFR